MSATIIPLRPREEVPMTHEHDDVPVPDADLAAWADADVLDKSAYGDAFFDALAADIERAVDADDSTRSTVVPLRRRPVWPAALAMAAALLLGLGLLLRTDPAAEGGPIASIDPIDAAEDPTPSLDDVARALGASAMAAILDGADEDEADSLLASRDWLDLADDDAVPTSYGSLLEELDDVNDYDTFFPL